MPKQVAVTHPKNNTKYIPPTLAMPSSSAPSAFSTCVFFFFLLGKTIVGGKKHFHFLYTEAQASNLENVGWGTGDDGVFVLTANSIYVCISFHFDFFKKKSKFFCVRISEHGTQLQEKQMFVQVPQVYEGISMRRFFVYTLRRTHDKSATRR